MKYIHLLLYGMVKNSIILYLTLYQPLCSGVDLSQASVYSDVQLSFIFYFLFLVYCNYIIMIVMQKQLMLQDTCSGIRILVVP